MTPLKANTFISFILLLVLLLLSGEAFSQRRRGRTVPTGSERTDTFNIEGVQRGDTLLKGILCKTIRYNCSLPVRKNSLWMLR